MSQPGLPSAVARIRRRISTSGVRHPVVKIHGQQRTGTNFVHRLIKKNAPDVVCPWPNEMGWKHGPYERHRRWKYLVVARHPVAWAESLHDWEVKHGRSTAGSLKAFLDAPSLDPRLCQVWGTTDLFEMYSTSYSAWLDSPLTTTVVRYEDLIAELEPAVVRLFDELAIAQPVGVADVDDRADTWQTAIERRQLDRSRSLDGWRDLVGDAEIELVRSRIPASLLDELGYTI